MGGYIMDLVGNNPGLSPLPSVPHIVSIMHMNKKPANGCYSTLIRIKNGCQCVLQ